MSAGMSGFNLRRAALTSTVWYLGGNVGQQIISIVVFIYLARVLTPTDFGLVALAAALIDLLSSFGRLGQMEALLQKPATERRLSTSFWLLIGVSVLLGGIIAASGPLLAGLYDSDRLVPILLVLAPYPLMLNVAQVHEAETRRAFRHRNLALRSMLATAVSGAVSVALALGGFAFWALVAQRLAFVAVYSGFLLVAHPWRPRFVFDLGEAKSLLKTGVDMSIASSIVSINGRVVDFIIGYFVGVAELGLVKIAFRLYDMLREALLQPIAQVSISIFSRFSHDHAQLRAAASRYLMLLTLVATPVYIGLGLISHDVVLLVVGAQWLHSADLLAVLNLTAPALATALLFGPIMVNAGWSRRVRSNAVAQMLLNIALVTAAAPFGVVPALIAVVIRIYACFFLNLRSLSRDLGMDLAPLGRLTAASLIACCAMAGGVWLANAELAASGLLTRLAGAVGAGAGCFVVVLAASALIPAFRGPLADNLGFVRAVFARRPTGGKALVPEKVSG